MQCYEQALCLLTACQDKSFLPRHCMENLGCMGLDPMASRSAAGLERVAPTEFRAVLSVGARTGGPWLQHDAMAAASVDGAATADGTNGRTASVGAAAASARDESLYLAAERRQRSPQRPRG